MIRPSIITPMLLGASLACSAVPYKFGPGSPARSQEMNDNFATLDSALQAVSTSKASSQDLSILRTKASSDSSTLAKALADSAAALRKSTGGAVAQADFQSLSATVSSKASSQDLSSLRTKASIDSSTLAKAIADSAAALRKSTGGTVAQADFQSLSATVSGKASNQDLSLLRTKESTDSAALAKAIADSAAALRKSIGGAITQSTLAGIRDSLRAKLDTSFRSQVALMTATGIHSQNYWLSEQDAANTLGTPANGLGKSAANSNQVVVGGDNGLHLKTASNDLVVPRTGDPTFNGSNLWHAGNLKPDSLPYIRANGNGKGNAVNTPFQVGNGIRGEGAAVVRDWRSVQVSAFLDDQRVTTLELNWYNQSWLLSQIRSGGMESGRFSVGFYDYNTKTTSEYFAIHPDGNAYFNKSLSVNGSFHATTMAAAIRASDVADYVFEPDYKLAPLSEVEEYIKANKHLPEVPSASEMEASGVDLAKMNMLLLKKVEELTLHAIEQNKRLESQESRMEQQQVQLDALTSGSRQTTFGKSIE
ncbi:MAG: hypothetical protein IPO40_16930 [Fibrobacteres bacterium]|nr:hypothetical protein [Fibrobacterota bacterium]